AAAKRQALQLGRAAERGRQSGDRAAQAVPADERRVGLAGDESPGEGSPRRYETANALSRDIQRYLADEGVEARPPSVGYRGSKLVRRHKGQVLAASLVLLALVGGIVGTTLGLFEARRQEQLARDETAEKELARAAEAERVKERDRALKLEALRVKERDAALDEANYQLDSSNFQLAVAAYDNLDVYTARLH